MHRHGGQRKHIIHSLDSLLYQVHALSFFLSPSIWIYICRVASQFHTTRCRDLDPNRSLRFWFILIFAFNFGALWTHAKEGAAQGRSIVLDFVGMASPPSKLHLLSLDVFILFLQMLLTTIAYETDFVSSMPADTSDPLLPSSATSDDAFAASTSIYPPKQEDNPQSELPYIIDLQLSTFLDRMRNPPPPPPPRRRSLDDLLPLPNTTPFRLSTGLQMFLRARQRTQREAQERVRRARNANEEEDGDGSTRREAAVRPDSRQDIPGDLDMDDT